MKQKMSINQICILSALQSDDRYGLELIKIIKEEANISILLGSLYNILSKLDREGLIESYWGEATSERGGARRKYYKITGHGETSLNEVRDGLTNWWGKIALA